MEERSIEVVNIDNKEEILSLGRRRAFDEAVEFIEVSKGTSGRVLVLYGLRRTGKTTLMKQLALYYGLDYIYQVNEGAVMNEVYEVLEQEYKNKTEFVFIDEVTNAKDFVKKAALLADKYACCKMNIVLAGTDSLGFCFVGRKALFDRMHILHLNYISFAEHYEVIKSANVDEYIMHGGLMKRGMSKDEVIDDIASAKRFLDSAVASNIVNSLKRAPEVFGYSEIRERSEGDICYIIQKLVEIYNGQIDTTIMNYEDYGLTVNAPIIDLINKLNKLKIPSERYSDINNEGLAKEYKEAINMNHELHEPVTASLVMELEKSFQELEILLNVRVRVFAGNGDISTIGYYDTVSKFIIQPAIKYYHLQEAIKVLGNSEQLKPYALEEREWYIAQLNNDICGKMLENIVILDVCKRLGDIKEKETDIFPRYEVFKVMFNLGTQAEIDMIIRDRVDKVHYAFEIKHTSNAYFAYSDGDKRIGQDKHLCNKNYLYLTEKNFWKRDFSCVLYNGESFYTTDDIYYINVVDFLVSLDKTGNVKSTIENLTKDLEFREREFLSKEDEKQKRREALSDIEAIINKAGEEV